MGDEDEEQRDETRLMRKGETHTQGREEVRDPKTERVGELQGEMKEIESQYNGFERRTRLEKRRSSSSFRRVSSLSLSSPSPLPSHSQSPQTKPSKTHPTSNLLNPDPVSHLPHQAPHRPRISPPRRIIQRHLKAPHPDHLLRDIRHPLRRHDSFVRALDADGEVGSDSEAHFESVSDGQGELFELVADRTMLVGYGVGLKGTRRVMEGKDDSQFGSGGRISKERRKRGSKRVPPSLQLTSEHATNTSIISQIVCPSAQPTLPTSSFWIA